MGTLTRIIGIHIVWILAVIIFMLFTCVLPFTYGATWTGNGDWLGDRNDEILLRLILWWLVRCVPSLIFVTFFYKGVKSKLAAVLQMFFLLICVSIIFIPLYWITTLFLALS